MFSNFGGNRVGKLGETSKILLRSFGKEDCDNSGSEVT